MRKMMLGLRHWPLPRPLAHLARRNAAQNKLRPMNPTGEAVSCIDTSRIDTTNVAGEQCHRFQDARRQSLSQHPALQLLWPGL